jgi:type II secretory pathway pseudopilin PulG
MPRPRPGFTLVETIVALVLLQIAMLAMAATAAVAARDFSDSSRRRRAHAAAQERIEWLRASACSVDGSGSGSRALDAGMIEYWRVTRLGRSRDIADSVAAPLSRGRQASVVSRGRVLCDD